MKFSQIFEEAKIAEDHLDENDPKFHEKLSKKLIDDQHIHIDDRFYLRSYSSNAHDGRNPSDDLHNSAASSMDLNRDLINHGEPKRLIDKRMHEAIMRNASPAKRDFHVYSGTSVDFGALAKQSKDGILHSPAHISASSSKGVAAAHVEKFNRDNTAHHIVHIHVQKGNPYLHISHLSDYEDEHETIIPSGVKLKYSHTTQDQKKRLLGRPISYNIHHFTIVGDNK